MFTILLKRYLEEFPGEQDNLKHLTRQIENAEKLDDRRNFSGHLTASAIILSPDKTKILLIHHKAYDMWQQPGGHVDKGEDILSAAKREASEETGVVLDTQVPLIGEDPHIPTDIDSHAVPARPTKDEPAHWHHDFRYVFVAKNTHLVPQEAEVFRAEWFEFNAPETARVQKVLTKLKQKQIIV